MPNQDISLNSYDPDAAKIQRQQRLAELLMQQSQEPLQPVSQGAPISPFSALAKMLKGYSARKMADTADAAYGDLQTKRRSDLADMLSKQYQIPETGHQVTAPGVDGGSLTPAQVSVTPPTLPGQTPQAAPPPSPAPSPPSGPPPVSPASIPDSPISNYAPARPTTPQEQLANSLSMMTSSNPMASQMGAPLYEQALQKQQAQQMLSGLDFSNVPQRLAPVIKSQIATGDAAGALKTYEDATKPLVAGGNVLAPTATGYTSAYEAPPSAIKEYEYAKQQGFKGSMMDYQHSKAAAVHITNPGAPADPSTIANWAANVHSGLASLRQVPQNIRGDVSNYLASEGGTNDSPEVASKYTRSSSLITAPYTKLSQYQLTSDAAPYIQRMAAAAQHPGSIGDADLLDSLIKLNTGGNAVTEAQANLITGSRSLSDTFSVMKNKLQNGGVLSDDQRKQVVALGKEIAGNYYKGFKPVYDAATKQLTDANIPKRYWTIPDINSFAAFSGFNNDGAPKPGAKPPTVSNW